MYQENNLYFFTIHSYFRYFLHGYLPPEVLPPVIAVGFSFTTNFINLEIDETKPKYLPTYFSNEISARADMDILQVAGKDRALISRDEDLLALAELKGILTPNPDEVIWRLDWDEPKIWKDKIQGFIEYRKTEREVIDFIVRVIVPKSLIQYGYEKKPKVISKLKTLAKI